MKITSSTINNNVALYGGFTFLSGVSTFTVLSTSIFQNKANVKGGVLYASYSDVGSGSLSPTVLNFTHCPHINNNYAETGAFTVLEHAYAELNI